MMNQRVFVFAAVSACCVLSLQAKVRLAQPFADGMVLQQGRIVPVWGEAAPGERVCVKFAGQTHEALANAKGDWRVNLQPMKASKESRVLTVGDISLKDVLVGEVWFCAGQSNTELPLCGSMPHFRDRKGAMRAALTHKPMIRFCYAANYRWSAEPKKYNGKPIAWKKFTPENLMAQPSFSAMGVYFALELYDKLDVPVGIVGTYWGGTRIEPWTPKCGFESVPACKDLAEWKILDAEGCKTATNFPWNRDRGWSQPRTLWNEQVAPWAPMAMKGLIWYQGCSNSHQHERYADMMQALYNGWAKAFENPDLKMNFVQLAPWGDPVIPYIQEAQAKFAAAEKNVHMAIINDVGNLRDIHPNDKETVGQRLALLALAHDYGLPGLKADSPVFAHAKASGEKVTLTFDHAESLYVYNPDFSKANGFELAGADGKFVPAKIENLISRKDSAGKPIGNTSDGRLSNPSTIVLSAEGVTAPMKVRYLYAKPWYGSVYNEMNLPLGAFHADVAK